MFVETYETSTNTIAEDYVVNQSDLVNKPLSEFKFGVHEVRGSLKIVENKSISQDMYRNMWSNSLRYKFLSFFNIFKCINKYSFLKF